MRHFAFLTPAERADLFAVAPQEFGLSTRRQTLGVALGATLYTPATRAGTVRDLLARRWPGLTTVVLCLEDSVADRDLEHGERQLAQELGTLDAALGSGAADPSELPLIFVRVRTPEHLAAMVGRLGPLLSRVAGFALPKFGTNNGAAFLAEIETLQGEQPLYAMPILEGAEIMHKETRTDSLLELSRLLHEHRHVVPCVRLGATDLSGLYGLRRSPDLTIYDIGVVRDCIADIVNVLGRPGTGHTIAGPVWEYFQRDGRVLKPQLRESPFTDEAGPDGRALRRELVDNAMDGLLREVLLDRANGLQGKTVIHPNHALPVNAMSAVTFEEHQDAHAVLAQSRAGGGIAGSPSENKMNEAKPHREWARRVLERAAAFGVLGEGHSYVSLLEASLRARLAV